jgi:hypothetical protein
VTRSGRTRPAARGGSRTCSGSFEFTTDGHEFIAFTAHSLEEERQALIDFIDRTERRAIYPDRHIYHYAPYEVSALRKLAKRHGVIADEVEELVETGVMFDLYETVKGSLRISDRSFSIKKLEPLYVPAGRIGVTNAVDFMVQYSVYRDALDKGQDRVRKKFSRPSRTATTTTASVPGSCGTGSSTSAGRPPRRHRMMMKNVAAVNSTRRPGQSRGDNGSATIAHRGWRLSSGRAEGLGSRHEAYHPSRHRRCAEPQDH